MDSNYEKEYLIAEQTHPWFICRRKMIYQLIKNLPKTARILEVGCGSGINLLMLKKKGFINLSGIEPSKGMKTNIGIPIFDSVDEIRGSFDVILILDVLEHIPNDSAVLNQLERILTDTGKVIITVPAFNFLWSAHDELNKHYRRYNRKMLYSAVKTTRLKIIRSFYWNSFLFLPIALTKILKRNISQIKSDIRPMSTYSSIIYSYLLYIENLCINLRIDFPFGVSLVAVLKKKNNTPY